MSNGFVLYQQEGPVVTLTFNRPASRNAIATAEDCMDIVAALERAEADSSVSCIIVTGNGSAF
ncbi:MAG: enoyl-CoA hydratase, partial [Halieaceae bacterium]|nr:enoyl-CoA hydratase [Halieaceae bacterium]